MASLRSLAILACVVGAPLAAASVGGSPLEAAEVGVGDTVCVRLLPPMPTVSTTSGCGTLAGNVGLVLSDDVRSRLDFDVDTRPDPRACVSTHQVLVVAGVRVEACADPMGSGPSWGSVCHSLAFREPSASCTPILS